MFLSDYTAVVSNYFYSPNQSPNFLIAFHVASTIRFSVVFLRFPLSITKQSPSNLLFRKVKNSHIQLTAKRLLKVLNQLCPDNQSYKIVPQLFFISTFFRSPVSSCAHFTYRETRVKSRESFPAGFPREDRASLGEGRRSSSTCSITSARSPTHLLRVIRFPVVCSRSICFSELLCMF